MRSEKEISSYERRWNCRQNTVEPKSGEDTRKQLHNNRIKKAWKDVQPNSDLRRQPYVAAPRQLKHLSTLKGHLRKEGLHTK